VEAVATAVVAEHVPEAPVVVELVDDAGLELSRRGTARHL